jgi:predicted DNA-binding protein (MmcQ/YjbR family)
LATGAGLSALSIPALMNLSNAAKRVGDGRSIRVSTSLRKRPNQTSDLTINVKNEDEISDQLDQNQPNQAQSNLPEKPKGLLSRVFNF